MSHHFSLSLDEAIERLDVEQLAIATDALFDSQILGSWSQNVASWADHANELIVVLRYEDLLLKPSKSFMKVARLVGLDKDAARVDRAIRPSSLSAWTGSRHATDLSKLPQRIGDFFGSAGRINGGNIERRPDRTHRQGSSPIDGAIPLPARWSMRLAARHPCQY